MKEPEILELLKLVAKAFAETHTNSSKSHLFFDKISSNLYSNDPIKSLKTWSILQGYYEKECERIEIIDRLSSKQRGCELLDDIRRRQKDTELRNLLIELGHK